MSICTETHPDHIDLNQRGSLERHIVGALKMAIDAHGPITRENASSAGHRVISAIKQFNKGLKNHARRKSV